MRVGLGHSARSARSDRPLILGGVEIPGRDGLAGPDDGDAASRAICDALAGAAGLKGEGEDGAPTGGGSGVDRLARTVRAVEGRNYQVVNVDLTLRTGRPPDEEHISSMRELLAERMHVSPGHVSVAGGHVGRGADDAADLTAVAVALVDRIESVDPIHASLRAGD